MPAQTTHITSTTQTFLDVYDITNDLVIMREGSVSLILNVNAINFGLFAEEEQDAVIYAYAGLLNSLNFPIQIVVKSQTKDVTAYLALLSEQEAQTTDQNKKNQIARYRSFVNNLIKERNVLDKKFYVVVTATPLEMGLLAPQTVIPGIKGTDVSVMERSVILQKAADTLEPRRDHLISQFARIGLFARQLTTQEIIQLFYTSYNPEAAEGQQITDTSSYTSTVVSAQVKPTANSVIGSFSQQAELAQQQAAELAAEQQVAEQLGYQQPLAPQVAQPPVATSLPPEEQPPSAPQPQPVYQPPQPEMTPPVVATEPQAQESQAIAPQEPAPAPQPPTPQVPAPEVLPPIAEIQ